MASLQQNGWTFSPPHNDWYRTVKGPNGTWQYIFANPGLSTTRLANIKDDPDAALLEAVGHRSGTAVDAALSSGANVNGSNISGDSALHIAIRPRKSTISKPLVRPGADLNTHSLSRNAPPDYKVNAKKEATVLLLLKEGANTAAQNSYGDTALHLAVASKLSEHTIRKLIEFGPDVNTRNNKGETALHIAVTGPNPEEITRLLLQCGGDAKARDNDGETVLHSAVTSSMPGEVIRLLLQFGSDIEARNNREETALLRALTVLDPSNFTELLQQFGIDGDASNRWAKTALHQTAAWLQIKPGFQCLIGLGADVNARDKTGESALHVAAKWRLEEAMSILLDHGADQNTKNNLGQSTYNAAAIGGIEMAKLIPKYRPRVDESDNKAIMAAATAISSQHDQTLQPLLSHTTEAHQGRDEGKTTVDPPATREELKEIQPRRNSEEGMSEEGYENEFLMDFEMDFEGDELSESGVTPRKASVEIDVKFTQLGIYEELCKQIGFGTKTSGTQSFKFQVHWDLLSYCQMELEEQAVLGSLLTISGTAGNAYATSCKEYLAWCWPRSGRKTLTTLEAAIASDVKVMDWASSSGPQLAFDLGEPQDQCATVVVSGSKDEVLEVAQQLAWFTAVFRIPKDGELCISDVKLERMGSNKFMLSPLGLSPVKNDKRPCWHAIFPSGVIAHGFPIPPREQEVGLELPFDLMVTLSGVLYPLEYGKGVILKGRSTALIPTVRYESSTQWHFVSSGSKDEQLLLDSITGFVSDWFETFDPDRLGNARTFLGYCRNAEIHLGTAESNYENIMRSGTKPEKSRVNIATKLSILIGSSGNFAFSLGTELTLPRSLRATTTALNLPFSFRLQRARKQPLILYDTETKRGWLVPELSVVLHIAHAQIAQQPDLKSEELDRSGYAEISGDGGQAASAAIFKACEVKLCDEHVDGRPLFFRDMVNKILTALESRKELRINREDTSGALQLRRSGLRGWDFADFVSFDFLSKRREEPIDESTGGSWTCIASQNPDMIVLFCRNLGEIIKPKQAEKVCGSLTPLPEGRCHLIASVPCLEQLVAVHYEPSRSSKLTPHLYWHRPSNGKLFEECESGGGVTCKRLQDLSKKDHGGPGDLEPHGAVIFGRNDLRRNQTCRPPENEAVGEEPATDSALAIPVCASTTPQQAEMHGSTPLPTESYEPELDDDDFLCRNKRKRPIHSTERTRNGLPGVTLNIHGN